MSDQFPSDAPGAGVRTHTPWPRTGTLGGGLGNLF